MSPRTRSPSCSPASRSTARTCPKGREHLDAALAAARQHRPDLARRSTPLARVLGDPATLPALRFQQTSGMVMAKGVEDCAFYRWSRLTSLNEVGGDPSVFAVTPLGVPRLVQAHRQRDWPDGDDHAVHARHQARRGRPGPHHRARRAARSAGRAPLDRLLGRVPLPDPGFGNLLWQAIVGAWPADPARAPGRLHGYAEKAMREAGDRTTWTAPDQAFEDARARGRRRGLRRPRGDRRWSRVSPREIAPLGLEQRARRQAAGSSPCPESPTSTRAASCGNRAWSTPTTAGRSTSTFGGACSPRSMTTTRGRPTPSTTPGWRSWR